MQRRLEVLVVAALVTCSGHALAAPLHVDGRWIRDGAGGVVILRGVNTAGNSKVPPFRPLTDAAMFDPLEAQGMNVVRLLFNWEAYEPHKNLYDESYLDYYVAAADAAASRGLRVIVDFHQDAYGRHVLSGCGEGFPAWTLPWWVIKATPDNSARCGIWGAQMIIDVGMHMAWGAFHDDATGARTRFLQMIERVAGRLATHDAVIGYDIMNEPWGDEPTDLHELHRDAEVALRRAHPAAILFVSPHALISAGGKSNLKKPAFSNFVYSPHFYDGAVVTLRVWLGGKPDAAFANMRSVADAWGVPLFVGEFGGGADVSNVSGYVAALYDGLDAALAGGAQWVYTPGWTPALKDGWNGEDLSIFVGTGAPRANFVARPFPRRISGTPAHFFVDSTPGARSLELSWEHVASTGATEIYVPFEALFGAAPVTIETSGEALTCSVAGDLVHCSSPVNGPKLVQLGL